MYVYICFFFSELSISGKPWDIEIINIRLTKMTSYQKMSPLVYMVCRGFHYIILDYDRSISLQSLLISVCNISSLHINKMTKTTADLCSVIQVKLKKKKKKRYK